MPNPHQSDHDDRAPDDLSHPTQEIHGTRPTGASLRATVEEALRQAADRAESEHAERAGRQRRYLECLSSRADLALLSSEAMWR